MLAIASPRAKILMVFSLSSYWQNRQRHPRAMVLFGAIADPLDPSLNHRPIILNGFCGFRWVV
jgi:hypothetical protein